jgi:hypothetical protein
MPPRKMIYSSLRVGFGKQVRSLSCPANGVAKQEMAMPRLTLRSNVIVAVFLLVFPAVGRPQTKGFGADDIRPTLLEATRLACKIHPLPSNEITRISELLQNLKEPQLPREELFAAVLRTVPSASTDWDYGLVTHAAEALLVKMMETDSTRSMALFNTWPAPQSGGPYALNVYMDLEKRLNDEYLRLLFQQDPSGALAYIKDHAHAVPEFSVWGKLLHAAHLHGHDADVHYILDRALEQLQKEEWSPAAETGFWIFLTSLKLDMPDLLQKVFDLYVQKLREEPQRKGVTYELEIGKTTIPLDFPEHEILSLLLGSGRQDLTLSSQLLGFCSDLNAKLATAGGLANAMKAGYSLRQKSEHGGTSSSMESFQSARSVMDELRGQSREHPEAVIRKLREAFGTAEQFDGLLFIASNTQVSEPEMSKLAYQTAREIISEQKDPDRKAGLLDELLVRLDTSRTEFAQEWIDFGFAKLRDLGEREAQELEGHGVTQWRNRVEQDLLACRAMIDFEKAKAYLDPIQDDVFRLQVMIKFVDFYFHSHGMMPGRY